MDRISGLRCQIDFFTEHGFLRAAKRTAAILLKWLCFSLDANLPANDKAVLREEMLDCKRTYGRRFWSDANSMFRTRVSLYGPCFGLFELARKFSRLFEKCGIRKNGEMVKV